MKLYRWVLWFLGFARGEYITYMMKRQESRLGVMWWLLVSATLAETTLLLHTWLSTVLFSILLFPVNFLAILLVWHVVKTPDQSE